MNAKIWDFETSLGRSIERSPWNWKVAGSSPSFVKSTYSLGNLICVVSHWELKVGVSLHFSNPSPWSIAKEKWIDSLPEWLPTFVRSWMLLETYFKCSLIIGNIYILGLSMHFDNSLFKWRNLCCNRCKPRVYLHLCKWLYRTNMFGKIIYFSKQYTFFYKLFLAELHYAICKTMLLSWITRELNILVSSNKLNFLVFLKSSQRCLFPKQ